MQGQNLHREIKGKKYPGGKKEKEVLGVDSEGDPVLSRVLGALRSLTCLFMVLEATSPIVLWALCLSSTQNT